MDNNVFQLQYAIDTFYFLMCGALVTWMAAGLVTWGIIKVAIGLRISAPSQFEQSNP